MTRRTRWIIGCTAAGLTAGVVLGIPALVRARIGASLERAGYVWEEGELDVSVLHGRATIADARLVREREDGRLALELPDADASFSLRGVLAKPLVLEHVRVRRPRIEVFRRGPSPARERLPRALRLERVDVEDAELHIEDTGPRTFAGEPFRLDLTIPRATLRGLDLQDAVRSVLASGDAEARIGERGALRLEGRRLKGREIALSGFSTYMAEATGLALRDGRSLVDIVCALRTPDQAEEGDAALSLEVYLEVEGLDVEALPAPGEAEASLGRRAIAAYLRRRGAFFCHAFPVTVAADDLGGRPAHDLKAIGVGIGKALADSVARDRIDLRRPTPRPLHPAVAWGTLGAKLASLREERRAEVFEGALEGRVVEGIEVEVRSVSRSLVLRAPRIQGIAIPGGQDAALQVEVRGLPVDGLAEGARVTLARAVIDGLDERDGAPVLVLDAGP